MLCVLIHKITGRTGNIFLMIRFQITTPLVYIQQHICFSNKEIMQFGEITDLLFVVLGESDLVSLVNNCEFVIVGPSFCCSCRDVFFVFTGVDEPESFFPFFRFAPKMTEGKQR